MVSVLPARRSGTTRLWKHKFIVLLYLWCKMQHSSHTPVSVGVGGKQELCLLCRKNEVPLWELFREAAVVHWHYLQARQLRDSASSEK